MKAVTLNLDEDSITILKTEAIAHGLSKSTYLRLILRKIKRDEIKIH